MAQTHQLPGPMVRGRAGFDPDETGRERAEEIQHLRTSQLPPHQNLAASGDPMDLKYVLRQIKSDDSDLLHLFAP